jgi:hypothetical protein
VGELFRKFMQELDETELFSEFPALHREFRVAIDEEDAAIAAFDGTQAAAARFAAAHDKAWQVWERYGRRFMAEAKVGHIFYAQQNYTTPKIAVSDGEIATDLLVVEHMRLLGGVAHLFDRDRVEVGEKGFARPAYGRINHPLKQHRV